MSTTSPIAACWGRAPRARGDLAEDWWIERVDYDVASPTTAALFRVRGEGWSRFVKVVQSYRHWPLLHVFQPTSGPRLGTAAWRFEVDLYQADLGAVLPSGLRLASLHGVEELGDDRVALLLEDVATAEPWDGGRYVAAARLLGRLNARLTAAAAARDLPPSPWDGRAERTEIFTPAASSRGPCRGRTPPPPGPIRSSPAGPTGRCGPISPNWRRGSRPCSIRCVVSRSSSATAIATPHILLVPADRSATFAVIDWAMCGTSAVGDDLGQLLLGHAHDGLLAVADLPALHGVIVDSYRAGLADDGVVVSSEIVRYGMDAGMAIRSAFTALPFDRLGEPVTGPLVDLIAERLELTRYLVDVGLALSDRGPARRQLERHDASSTSCRYGAGMSPVQEIPLSTIDGQDASLGDHAGNVLLVVNVASKCGLTPQYEALEALYEAPRTTASTVLGFPANNFGAQEPGTNEEIAEFCSTTYDVQFPLFAKISVAGDDQHPLYRALTTAIPRAEGDPDGVPRAAARATASRRTRTPTSCGTSRSSSIAKDGSVARRFAPDDGARTTRRSSPRSTRSSPAETFAGQRSGPAGSSPAAARRPARWPAG